MAVLQRTVALWLISTLAASQGFDPTKCTNKCNPRFAGCGPGMMCYGMPKPRLGWACCPAPVKASLPGPHDLICDFFNDTAVMDSLQHTVCKKLPAKTPEWGTKACNETVKHLWSHEASVEACPGFPKPWAPFKPIDDALHKLFCWGMKKESAELPVIEKDVCGNKTWLKKKACEEGIKLVWNHMLGDCKNSTSNQQELIV